MRCGIVVGYSGFTLRSGSIIVSPAFLNVGGSSITRLTDIKPTGYENLAYFKTIYKHYEREMADYNDIRTTMTAMVTPLSQQLQAGAGQLQTIVQNPATPEADRIVAQQQLAVVTGELEAIGKIATGLGGMPTAGSDRFHRTNDVFGVGVEINF